MIHALAAKTKGMIVFVSYLYLIGKTTKKKHVVYMLLNYMYELSSSVPSPPIKEK